jgi:hypothetical protein
MNKFVSTALGLAVVGSIGAADPGDGDWLGLDSEINSLASSLAPAQGVAGQSALIRSYYGSSSDDISTGGGNDLSGFGFNDIDISLYGSTGDYGWRISGDLDSGSFELEDAYVDWACGTYARARMGMMKPNVLRGGIIDPENTLMIDRTVLGAAFDGWDTGVQASGENNGVNWSFGLFNGPTGEEVDHFYAFRVAYDFGAGAGSYDGARGGNDQLNATLGLAVTSNTSAVTGPSDNMSTFVDFNGNYGQIGFGVEFGQVDDDDSVSTASDFGWIAGAPLGLEGDTSPYSLTGSYLINPDWEVGLRLEDLDDTDDTSLLSLGATYFRNGNNAKWQAQYTDVSRDTGSEGNYVQIGLTVGSSR